MKVNYNDLPSVKRSLKQSIDSLYYFDEPLINNTFFKDSIIFRIALFLTDSYEEVMSEDDVKLKVDCSIKNMIMIHERDNDDYNIIYLKVCNNENVESVKKKLFKLLKNIIFYMEYALISMIHTEIQDLKCTMTIHGIIYIKRNKMFLFLLHILTYQVIICKRRTHDNNVYIKI